MRILIIASEEWNDYVYSNGVLTNWFTDFPAEFAEIYTSPGLPINNVCDNYFQISEGQMLKSMFFGNKAGRIVNKPTNEKEICESKDNARRKGAYGFFKSLSLYINTPVVMLRDFIWCFGRYNNDLLRSFVDDFNPDIVFCPRKISPKLIRLEHLVSTITKAPFVAFTGDDEASMTGCSISPLYWLRKWYIHRMFKRHSCLYSHYFMHSEDQAKEYQKEYGLNTSVLFKCGDFSKPFTSKPIGDPIRLVYAGRLYCNRWIALVEIGKALQQINREKTRIVLDIYTQEKLTGKQKKAFEALSSVHLKNAVTSSELKEIYKRADIALHVESFDKKYRKITRVSFSTKIIDLLASSCAIVAICWDKHAGYQYLHKNDAAICISDYDNILPQMEKICNNPNIISEYARKAYQCGKGNHQPEIIRNQIFELFENIIKNHK